jgi:hypothetical protein
MPSHGRMLDCVDMPLPRTFVGFSGADILQYRLMCAWKAHEHIDFDFADFQLDEAIASENEYYIKRVCRNKIRRADTYALLIGQDTFTKTTFVKWEIEVAIEGAFEPIVPAELFVQARAIIQARHRHLSDDELLDRLRSLLTRHGNLSGLLIDEAEEMPSSSVYTSRFGGLYRAYGFVS